MHVSEAYIQVYSELKIADEKSNHKSDPTHGTEWRSRRIQDNNKHVSQLYLPQGGDLTANLKQVHSRL